MRFYSRISLELAMLVALGIAGASRAEAQTAPPAPAIIYACYVPLTGTVYRIKEPDVKQACTSAAHVAFSWTDGAGGGVTSHGALTGLENDDHPQYLLANGSRSAPNGFAVTGTMNTGAIPVSGPGARMMWYPGKAAFRVGTINGTEWDDANIGLASFATGSGTRATGSTSAAFGLSSSATATAAFAAGAGANAAGYSSIALGPGAVASGNNSAAIGSGATASATNSLATGNGTTASGTFSTAMGTNASTNGFTGSFVYGDNWFTPLANTADNQFLVRAAGGFMFRTAHDLTTGCNLPAGSGTWSCTSSRLAKERFENLNGDEVLRKIDGMAIQSWSYRTEPGNIRHVGPTAQDFRAAFGLGTTDEAISLVDIDGVNMLGVQALTRRANDQAHEIETLRAENARQGERLAALEQAITRLTAGERRP